MAFVPLIFISTFFLPLTFRFLLILMSNNNFFFLQLIPFFSLNILEFFLFAITCTYYFLHFHFPFLQILFSWKFVQKYFNQREFERVGNGINADTNTINMWQVNLEQSAMEEILKFGEFSSLLNKSHSANATSKNEDFASIENERKMKEQEEYIAEEGNEDKDKDANRDKDNYGCQVEDGQDIV